MKNKIYIKICNDIDKEKNEFLKKILLLLKDKINQLNDMKDITITDEDVLIVLSSCEDTLRGRLEETYDDEMREDIENTLLYIEDIFKSNTYNGDIVNQGKLSNGLYYKDSYTELERRKKALNSRNKIALAFQILALINFMLSIKVGIDLMDNESSIWSEVIVSGLLSSLFLFGFSEIIQILHDIRKEIYRK